MNRTRSIQGVVGLAVLGLAVGCGSSSSSTPGGSADFAALYTQYSKPSGTLTKSNLKTVATTFGKEQGFQSIPGASLGATGGLKPQGLPTSGGNCTVSGTYSLGALTYSSTYVSASFTYNACSYVAGESVNGTLSFADWTTPPATEIFSGALQVTDNGTTDDVDLNFALVNGSELEWNVVLSDGTNVLVSGSGSWNATTDSGTFTVTDSVGTWSCTWTAGAGTCTGSNGQPLGG